MNITEVTSAMVNTVETIRGKYPQNEPAVARYVGTVGPFIVFETSEPDAVGTCYVVFDLWHQPENVSLPPARVARLTGAEARALAALLQEPG